MKITIQAVIEMLGRPSQHVKDTLTQLIATIGKEQGYVLKDSLVHEPTLAEGSEDLYTTFAEITLECDSIDSYFRFVFRYLPAHIDILSPENLPLKKEDFTELANRISARMHEYDSLAKKALFERNLAVKQLKEFNDSRELKASKESKENTQKSKSKKKK